MVAQGTGLCYSKARVATRNDDKRALFGGKRGEVQEQVRVNADKEIEAEIDDLEKDMNELRATYELYFMGVEKNEPTTQRDLIKAKLRRWQELRPRNTGLKFRIQQLKARMVSQENYWQRIHREREAGTYKRDVAKVHRREAELARQQIEKARAENPRQATVHGAGAPPVGGQLMGSGELKGGRSGAEGPAVSRDAMLRPRAASAEDLTEPKLKKLYQTYMGARRRCGEATDLRYEDMAAALRKQVPRLMSQTGAASVEFKVVIRAGKAVLKAIPKTADGKVKE
jgi:hypothetical protein